MMSRIVDKIKSQLGFIYPIVETVKRTEIQPASQTNAIRLRFSLIAGVMLAVLSLPSPFSPLYAQQKGTWTKKADMRAPRFELSTSVVDGKIYAIGGLSQRLQGSVARLEEYDPATDTWTQKANMPTARGWLSAGAVNGKIYAIGGTATLPNRPDPNPDAGSTVEEYDPLTDTWRKKADMPTSRASTGLGVVNGKIYVIGGAPNPDKVLSTVEEYDPATNKWTRKADMPTARGDFSTYVVEGKIYAIGGWNGMRTLSTVEMYDPLTDKWVRKAKMPIARVTHATSAVNGKIYVIGGADGNGRFLSRVEEYDLATEKWSKKADMPTGRVNIRDSASTVDGKIYVMGGFVGGQNVRNVQTVVAFDPGLPTPVKVAL